MSSRETWLLALDENRGPTLAFFRQTLQWYHNGLREYLVYAFIKVFLELFQRVFPRVAVFSFNKPYHNKHQSWVKSIVSFYIKNHSIRLT